MFGIRNQAIYHTVAIAETNDTALGQIGHFPRLLAVRMTLAIR